MKVRALGLPALVVIVLVAVFVCEAEAGRPRLISRAGKGALYELDGHRVVILAGSPEEMGYQHGALLRDAVHEMVTTTLTYARASDNLKKNDFFAGSIEKAYERCKPFIPPRYLREMDALADAAGIARKHVHLANIFPELFHCSGFALKGKATVGGELLHGRILDYMTQIGLQRHAVTFICLPEGLNAFVNVGFGGFIGSVTGMNEKQVAFGEIGGRGVGRWNGMPMGFLMRYAMEEAHTLADAERIFRDTRRTCEYYYVISDGKNRDAVGLHCTPTDFKTVRPGQWHKELHTPVEDTVLFSEGKRYPVLVRRVKEKYGRITPADALEMMKRPVAMKSNLHCVLFAPERLMVWAAIAADPEATTNFRACDQPYLCLDVADWLRRGRSPAESGSAAAPPTETRLPEVPNKLSGKGHDAARQQISPAVTPELRRLLALYKLPRREFDWSASLLANTPNYAAYELRFPSPMRTDFPLNNTVVCEYYRAHGSRQRPAVVVLHILDGKFVVARLICSSLANSGTDALMVKLPFYGERRPPDVKKPMQDPESFRLLVMQGTADIRRAAALLAGFDYIPANRVGVCGVSLGGFVGALAAGVDANFGRCALVLAGGDLHAVLTNGSRETVRMQRQFAEAGLAGDKLAEFLQPIDPVTFASRLTDCAMLMLNVTGDEVVPAASARALARAAGGKEIVWYAGAKHTSMIVHLFDALGRIKTHFAAPAW